MSAITEETTTVAPFDDETPTVHVTRHFKTTGENKTEVATVCLNDETREHLEDISLRSARWRSFGQLVNDALIYYLDGEGGDESAGEIIEESTWSSRNQKSFAITLTLWTEIDMMVKHSHTPWNTKQEFIICALFSYVNAGYPIMERR